MEDQREVKLKISWTEILIYHGTVRVWNHIQNLINPNHPGVLNHLHKEEREEVIPPQPVKQSLQADKSEAKVEEKWDPMKEDSVIDKGTEKWVEGQNEFFKKGKEKQKEGAPVKFEPRGPVKILQR